ncbi:MAG: sigma-54-dependent Fis family transcriptional regulator [Deltaproteobacteria bacterium]|nr:sigma-54-dependent Fis family transcriptional regulator [Deltaproteobacteria bacterium]
MTARILVVDDETTFLDAVQRKLRMVGHTAVTLESDPLVALSRLDTQTFDVAFLDVTMPGIDGLQLLERILERSPATACVMVTAHDDIGLVMRATRLGAFDYLVKPLQPAQLVDALDRALAHRRMVELLEVRRAELVDRELDHPEAFAEILTCDERTLRVLREAELHARSEIPVLITGETGVGKELLARGIHRASARRDGPFVAVNMLSLSSSLFESEFFGHRRGAFTGAIADKVGYLEQAGGGTLFLDEIGDLPMELQGKLLRILQEGEFTPVGDTRPRRANARFVAATHQDLAALVADGRFRKDLLYRLRFAQLSLSPLRERRDDLRLLAIRFIQRSARPEVRLSEAAEAALVGHDWPGNVRELRGVIESAANLAEKGEILPRHLGIPIKRRPVDAGAVDPHGLPPLAEVERQHILRVYEATQKNKTHAAGVLGISVQTLHRKLRAYRVS